MLHRTRFFAFLHICVFFFKQWSKQYFSNFLEWSNFPETKRPVYQTFDSIRRKFSGYLKNSAVHPFKFFSNQTNVKYLETKRCIIERRCPPSSVTPSLILLFSVQQALSSFLLEKKSRLRYVLLFYQVFLFFESQKKWSDMLKNKLDSRPLREKNSNPRFLIHKTRKISRSFLSTVLSKWHAVANS